MDFCVHPKYELNGTGFLGVTMFHTTPHNYPQQIQHRPCLLRSSIPVLNFCQLEQIPSTHIYSGSRPLEEVAQQPSGVAKVGADLARGHVERVFCKNRAQKLVGSHHGDTREFQRLIASYSCSYSP